MFSTIRSILTILIVFLTHIAFSQYLVINEILSSNIQGIKDSQGDYSDWIEIKNTTRATINLGGYYLSDKKENPLKWEFPPISIDPLGYILVFASEKKVPKPNYMPILNWLPKASIFYYQIQAEI